MPAGEPPPIVREERDRALLELLPAAELEQVAGQMVAAVPASNARIRTTRT
jgi:hypothetical protein